VRRRLEPSERFTLGQRSSSPLEDSGCVRHSDTTGDRRHVDEDANVDVVFLVGGEHANEDIHVDLHVDIHVDLHLHVDLDLNFLDFHFFALTDQNKRFCVRHPEPIHGLAAAAATSSTPIWAWIVLALVLVGVISAYVLRRRSTRAASAEAHQRALDAYASAMALHDQVAVLPMASDVERPRMLSEVSASLDRVTRDFAVLATEPSIRDATAEIGDVQLSLGSVRATLQAQIVAGAIDPDLLRERLLDLDRALQAFRQRVSPTTP